MLIMRLYYGMDVIRKQTETCEATLTKLAQAAQLELKSGASPGSRSASKLEAPVSSPAAPTAAAAAAPDGGDAEDRQAELLREISTLSRRVEQMSGSVDYLSERMGRLADSVQQVSGRVDCVVGEVGAIREGLREQTVLNSAYHESRLLLGIWAS